jgi:hypothetical protein
VIGHLLITTKGGLSHNGITMQITGIVTLQLSAKSVGLFEAFYNSLKPIHIMDYTCEIQKPGKLKDGANELPFEFKLEPLSGQQFYETYHGVYVNISYQLKAEMKGTFFTKSLQRTVEFIVHIPVI